MTCPPDKINTPTRPSLSVDWEVYAAMLEDSDMPLDDQKELIETLWSIVVMFVDLGYDIKPTTSHFEIIMEPNGGFAVTYLPPKNGDVPIAPHRGYDNCDNLSEYLPEATFYPINSINGFTDWRTLLVDLINQGYE